MCSSLRLHSILNMTHNMFAISLLPVPRHDAFHLPARTGCHRLRLRSCRHSTSAYPPCSTLPAHIYSCGLCAFSSSPSPSSSSYAQSPLHSLCSHVAPMIEHTYNNIYCTRKARTICAPDKSKQLAKPVERHNNTTDRPTEAETEGICAKCKCSANYLTREIV